LRVCLKSVCVGKAEKSVEFIAKQLIRFGENWQLQIGEVFGSCENKVNELTYCETKVA